MILVYQMFKLHRNSKLSEKMAINIRLFLHRHSVEDVERIAKMLGVSVVTLRNCAKGITYKHLDIPVHSYWDEDRRGKRSHVHSNKTKDAMGR